MPDQQDGFYVSKTCNFWKYILLLYGNQLDPAFPLSNTTLKICQKIIWCFQVIITIHVSLSLLITHKNAHDMTSVTLLLPLVLINILGVIMSTQWQVKEKTFSSLFEKINFYNCNDEKCKKSFRLLLLLLIPVTIGNFYCLVCCSMYYIYFGKILSYSAVVQYHVFGLILPEKLAEAVAYLLVLEIILQQILLHFFVSINILFFSCICNRLVMMFEDVNESLRNCLKRTNISNKELNQIRQKHEQITEYVNLTSSLFSPALLFCLLSSTVNIIFSTRSVYETNVSQNPILLIHNIVICVNEIIKLYAIFRPALGIQREAHWGATSLLVNVRQKFSQNDGVEINFPYYLLFSLRLVCTEIGINASGLFILNSATLISLLGGMLAYVIVMYQF